MALYSTNMGPNKDELGSSKNYEVPKDMSLTTIAEDKPTNDHATYEMSNNQIGEDNNFYEDPKEMIEKENDNHHDTDIPITPAATSPTCSRKVILIGFMFMLVLAGLSLFGSAWSVYKTHLLGEQVKNLETERSVTAKSEEKIMSNTDECSINKCNSNATCNINSGSLVCSCNAGYHSSGQNCSDIDECAQSLDTCDINATCVNTMGSFECTCNHGFRGTGHQCTDTDECVQSLDTCDVNATCVNTVGSYKCTCNHGFHGAGQQCTDIDECAQSLDTCDINATCVNTMGSFECTCNHGFRGTGHQCTDIDECALSSDNCDRHAMCVNTMGSFECTWF